MRHNGRKYFKRHSTSASLPITRPTYFHAIRGVGQGDVGSPTLWNMMMDILLCSLDKCNMYPFYTLLPDFSLIRLRDSAFADDLLSYACSLPGLQAKADLVSAFCIIFGIDIAVTKLRAFLLDFSCTNPNPESLNIVIHKFDWQPVRVPVITNGIIKYLGVEHEISTRRHQELHTSQFRSMLALSKRTLSIIFLPNVPLLVPSSKLPLLVL
jgi:hypothetical protein